MRNRLLFSFIVIFLLLQLPMLALKLPQEREGWLADIAYHWKGWGDPKVTGSMAPDIPFGSTWSSGRGKSFYFVHSLFYKIFGIGLFQGRMLTFFSALLLLFLLFQWIRKNISFDAALFSTIFLMISFSFWPFLPMVSQDIPHFLFLFASFYSLYLAITLKKRALFFATGLISALSVDLSYRGIEVVACVWLVFLLSPIFLIPNASVIPSVAARREARDLRKIFFTPAGYMLLGSFVAFLYWMAANIWPMGIENFMQYHIFPSRTEREPHFFKMIANEINRFFNFIQSQRHLAKTEIAYWIILIFLFFKYRLHKKFPYSFKYLLCWLLIAFLITSLVSQLDTQLSPVYMLLYAIFISIFCGMALEELWLRHRKFASVFLIGILIMAGGYQVSRLAIHLSAYKSYSLAAYHKKLRSHVDLTKNMIGEMEFWYAFTDAQYYGGVFYIIRVINVLGELKYAHEYGNSRESAEALLKVLKKRGIKYIVTHPGSRPVHLKYFMSQYFSDQKWPEKNFKFIGRVNDCFNGNRFFQPGPKCHSNVEFYEIISYDS